jgi:predicted Zn-dependent protease
VIGHELSHLDHNHLLINVKRMKLAEQAFADKSQFSPERFLTATAAMARLWSRPFRPEDEQTADLDGARWAYEADYDPREMIRVIVKIGELEKKRPLPLPSYFLSHPPAEQRRKTLEKLYHELQRTNPKEQLYVGKENLRRRTARSER